MASCSEPPLAGRLAVLRDGLTLLICQMGCGREEGAGARLEVPCGAWCGMFVGLSVYVCMNICV